MTVMLLNVRTWRVHSNHITTTDITVSWPVKDTSDTFSIVYVTMLNLLYIPRL